MKPNPRTWPGSRHEITRGHDFIVDAVLPVGRGYQVRARERSTGDLFDGRRERLVSMAHEDFMREVAR